MDTNILNIKCVIWLHVLSNTEVTFEAQFMKKFITTETDLKKGLFIKKACTGVKPKCC